MKIAYISRSVIPSLDANSVHVMKMCQAIKQLGYEPQLFAFRGDGLFQMDIWNHYGIKDQFPIRFESKSPQLKNYDKIISAVKTAKQERFDLVYTRAENIAAISSWAGLPTVCELHNVPGGVFGPWWFKLFSWGRTSLLLVTITNALHTLLKYRYPRILSSFPSIVAPDGIDLERFENMSVPVEARKNLSLPEQFTIGYAGHFYEGRGIEIILHMAKSLPDVQFLLLGGQPERIERYRKIAMEQSLANVKLLGFIPNADLPTYLAASDVLIMPYQRRIATREGGDIGSVLSPMKLFEYMATGRLILSSDLPVLREILNENNSILLDPDDISAWVRGVECARDNPDLRRKIATQARKDVEQYTWHKRASKILNNLRIYM